MRELVLENFVLIKKGHLLFEPGFTVFTGETGAGKSLLVRAVKLLMGERQHQGLIYPGERQAFLQGVFHPPSELIKSLEEQGITVEDELIIHRMFSEESRSRTYVNGRAVTLGQLRSITSGLLSIAGQHEYQGLLKSDTPIKWLDLYGGLDHRRKAMEEAYADYRKAVSRLQKLREEMEKAMSQRDAIRAELEEIEHVSPKEGEEEALLEEIERLRASTTLRELAEGAFKCLYAGTGSCEESLSHALHGLEKISSIDKGMVRLSERLDATLTEVREVAYELREYLQGLSFDPGRLDELEARLNAIRRLLLRYGPTIEDCLKKRAELKGVLDSIERPDEAMLHMETALNEAEERLIDCASHLSRERKAAAMRLEQMVNQELQGLFPGTAMFKVDVQSPSPVEVRTIGPDGMDRVRFLFTPNPGLPGKPLNEIASGGELSRVMLALRIAQGQAPGTTILFDEIDAGIGGETAHLVGEKLRQLSSSMQVICVSHFPQVASRADGHFAVRKITDGHITWTEIEKLQGRDRTLEIARMLGGRDQDALSYAMSLLNLETSR